MHADDGDALLLGKHALQGARLVEHVDGLVRQVAVDEVLGGQFHGGPQGFLAELHPVMLLVAALEALEDQHRLLVRRLEDLDLLEAPGERLVAVERGLELVEGSRSDAAQIAVGERRLEQVRRVHRAAARRAGTDQHVDLVDEEDGARLLRERLHDALQALLELAAELGPGEQGAQVERVERSALEYLGHLALRKLEREPLGDGGLPHARLADEDGVVLAAPAKDLDGALQLGSATDQRVDLSGGGAGDEIDAVGAERIVRRGLFVLLALGSRMLVGLLALLELA